MKNPVNKWIATLSLGLALGYLSAGGAAAQDNPDPHAMHHHMMTRPDINRSVAEYAIPEIKLVREDGKMVSLPDELNDGRPVVLNFIYTTCTTICPLMSQTLERLQGMLGADRDKVHLVSISIDPEADTPVRLAAYARRHHAGPEWQHYTGTVQASAAAQRAFDVYRGDKMSHTPVTLVRLTPGKTWIRFDGFASAEDLLKEIQSREIASGQP
jgi:protein SCO1